MSKPYKPRTLEGATKMVHKLMKQRREDGLHIQRMHHEMLLLARLAADGPCFGTPVELEDAKLVRDRILRQFLNLNPNGTWMHKP